MEGSISHETYCFYFMNEKAINNKKLSAKPNYFEKLKLFFEYDSFLNSVA